MLKYAYSAVDIGNHRYTYVQNGIILKCKCDIKQKNVRHTFFTHTTRSYSFVQYCIPIIQIPLIAGGEHVLSI